ncbi:MAG: hypothetical protein LQ342_001449 [Letrouitia transgressa]|nr:MAG: hypothetical protein LQ342_001449 [Letrouitia transgressa]
MSDSSSGLRYSDSSNEHSAPLLAKSTQGATYLILLQIGSRALTFLVNQVLLRYLSPDLLGISTQLDLYSTSVLYFARESLRVALQRQASGTRSPKLKENGEDQRKQKTAKSYDEFEKIQEAVNLSYIAIGLGVPLACIFGYLYFRSADAAVLRTPFIRESLITYTVSTMLELVSEPCFIVSQQQMLYGTRASAESLATFTRCILTCASAIWASRSNMGLGALPFAIGQLSYAIVLNLVYQFKIMHLSTQKNFSLLPKRVNSPSPTLTLSYFSTPHITLASNLYAQSVFKHLLTTGDALLIAALTSLESQGAYTLAANYGGLLARTIFQPIEESSRSLFGRLLPSQAPRQPPLPPSTPPPPTQRPTQPSRETLQASSYLLYILRLYTLLSLPLLALAPPLCPTFLSFLAGPRWRNTAAPGVLAAYVYYIPLLAVNGILEAYVAATATPHQLRAQSVAMVGFSAAMGVTGWLSLRVWRWGARGLVVSNAVGMAVRIAWSWGFVGRDLEERGVLVVGKGVLPRWQTAVVSLVAGWVMRGLNLEIEKGWGGLWRAVGVVGGYGVTL